MEAHNKLGIALLVVFVGVGGALFGDVLPDPRAAFLLSGMLMGGGLVAGFSVQR